MKRSESKHGTNLNFTGGVHISHNSSADGAEVFHYLGTPHRSPTLSGAVQ